MDRNEAYKWQLSRGIPVRDEYGKVKQWIGANTEIFKRFHRVAGENEETYAGLGIGLFLAHEIAERHQGEIKGKSELGKGSVFTFELSYTNKK